MKSQVSNRNPEGVSAVWKAVHKLEEELEHLRAEIEKPSIWSKFWAERAWAIPTALGVLGVICGFVWWVGGVALNAHISSALAPVRSDVQQIKTQLSDLLSDLQLRRLADNPANPENIKQAQNVLQTAQANKVTLTPDTIADTGRKFVIATTSNPDAWNAVFEFLKYRSYLNLQLNVTPSPSGAPSNTTTQYTVNHPSNMPLPIFNVAGLTSKDKAARLNPIGQELRSTSDYGNQWIIATGGGVLLDGYQFKNVVFTGVHVVYMGGSLRMENVYFVGCTFDFVRNAHSQEIAVNVLSSPAVTVTIG
jgi:hypothetical protein